LESSRDQNFNKPEKASTYPKEDPNYREHPVKVNPIIEKELEKHKLVIEGRFNASLMNQSYKF